MTKCLRGVLLAGVLGWAAGCSDQPAGSIGGIPVEDVGAKSGSTAATQNAQSIATAAASVRAAGYAKPWATKEAAVEDLVRGIDIKLGSQDIHFGAGAMNDEEKRDAMLFLVFDPAPPGTVRFIATAQP